MKLLSECGEKMGGRRKARLIFAGAAWWGGNERIYG
jgi:hypothetical protein